MNFKLLIFVVLLGVCAFASADNEQINSGVLERFQNNANRPLTISEMVAIMNNNQEDTNPKFDAKRIFQAPIMCAPGERVDNQGRCRKFMN